MVPSEKMPCRKAMCVANQCFRYQRSPKTRLKVGCSRSLPGLCKISSRHQVGCLRSLAGGLHEQPTGSRLGIPIVSHASGQQTKICGLCQCLVELTGSHVKQEPCEKVCTGDFHSPPSCSHSDLPFVMINCCTAQSLRFRWIPH